MSSFVATLVFRLELRARKNTCSNEQVLKYECRKEATRTPDPYVPNVVRYQLRYFPIKRCKSKEKNLYRQGFIFIFLRLYQSPSWVALDRS